jgi:FtsZ-interacting cell division protein ZipA
MRKPFIRKPKAPYQNEGEKQEGQATTEQTLSNSPQTQNTNVEPKNEAAEQKQTDDNQTHHAKVESTAEEKDKKVIIVYRKELLNINYLS